MNKIVCTLGRQPAIGLAELEALFGAGHVTPLGDTAAIVETELEEFPFARLGSVIKAGKLLHESKSAEWQAIHDYLVKVFPEHLKYAPESGKLNIGLSTTAIDVSVKKQQATALELKKVAKKHGQAVRVVPNKTHELSSAQVFHNKLYTDSGWELCFVQSDGKVVMSQTNYVQDIDAYTARDQKRPKRDAKVGMLPPKLAQTLTNLASGELQPPDENSPRRVVLDPFCGTGVVLQEALLMGYNTFGTDIDLRMVQYSEANLEWLQTNFATSGEFHVTIGDATEFDWRQAFDIVACETYLGRPFSHAPQQDTLKKVVQDVNTIHKKFLENLVKQTDKGTRLCLAVPAWKTKDGFLHLPTLDHLEKMGYTRLSFKHVTNEDLIYHREGQIVGRELVVLIRK
jgi:tRNA G10  N-methylase Trm11